MQRPPHVFFWKNYGSNTIQLELRNTSQSIYLKILKPAEIVGNDVVILAAVTGYNNDALFIRISRKRFRSLNIFRCCVHNLMVKVLQYYSSKNRKHSRR